MFYTHVARRGNNILIRAFDDEGNRVKRTIPFKPVMYYEAPEPFEGCARMLDGTPLAPVVFDNMTDAAQKIESCKKSFGVTIYGQSNMVHQAIARLHPGDIDVDLTKIVSTITDIEVCSGSFDADGNFVRGPFPEPGEAKYPITAISLIDYGRNRVWALGLEVFEGKRLGTFDPDEMRANDPGKYPDDVKIEYEAFDDECDLLRRYLDIWESLQADTFSGWNSNLFDGVYLYHRIKKLMGSKAANRLSPWGIVKEGTTTSRYGEEVPTVEFLGVAMIDYRELVEKHGYINPPDWKLGTVANVIIKEGKVDYSEEGNLDAMYVENYPKYIHYNIVDTLLILKMERKVKFFDVTYTLAYLAHCNYEDTLGTVNPWSAYANLRMANKGIQLPVIDHITETKTIVGGYVHEPIPGKYKKVATIDANSLYPHMAMQWNMGPETHISRDTPFYQRVMSELIDEVRARPNTEYNRNLLGALMNRDLLHEIIWKTDELEPFETLKKYDVSMSPNLAMFRRDIPGMWREVFQYLYDHRKVVKKQMLKDKQVAVNASEDAHALRAGNPIKHEENAGLTVSQLEAKSAQYYAKVAAGHAMQMALKIMMNSAYGAMSNKWFLQFYNTDIAEGITTGGQGGIQWVCFKIEKWIAEITGYDLGEFEEQYKFGKISVYADTDSAQFTLDPLIHKMFYEKGRDPDIVEVINFMDRFVNEVLEPKVNAWCEEYANLFNCPQNKLVFKREKLCDAGIWVAPKRYVVNVYDCEGVRYAEPEVMVTGLEAIRGNIPSMCQDWLIDCYRIAMASDHEEDIHNRVLEIERFYMKEMSVESMGESMTANNMEKYDEGGWYGKGTTRQVKAAYHFNRMVQEHQLPIKRFMSGDKISILPLLPRNPFGWDVIGYVGYLPPEFGMHGWVDRRVGFTKTFEQPLNNMLKAIGWEAKPKAKASSFFR